MADMENDVPGTLHKRSDIQFQSIGFVGRQEEISDNFHHLKGCVGKLVVVGPGVPVFAAALLAICAVVFGEIRC
jgi:hypothetical protein